MDVMPSYLEIRLHLVNGSVEEFVQDNPAAIRQIFETIQPQKIFSQGHLVIAGKYSMSAYACPAIAAVELVMTGYPDWPFPLGVDDIQQISEEEFWKRFEAEKDKTFVREQERTVGEPVTGFMEVELVNGEHLFAQISTKVALKHDQRHVVSQLFSAPCLFCRRPNGGIAFVNPSNIVHFTFNPGPANAPANAWPAHHKSKRENPRDTQF